MLLLASSIGVGAYFYINRTDPNALSELAKLRIQVEAASTPEESRVALDNLLEKYPTDKASLFQLAKIQFVDGEIDESIESIEAIEGRDPAPNKWIADQLSIYSTEKGTDRYDTKIVKYYYRVIQFDDQDLATRETLGLTLERMEENFRAAELLEEVVKNDPTKWVKPYNLFVKARKPERARAVANIAKGYLESKNEENENNAEHLVEYGEVLLALSEFEDAEKKFDRAYGIDRSKENLDHYLVLIRIWAQKTRSDTASQFKEQSRIIRLGLRVAPNDSVLLDMLAFFAFRCPERVELPPEIADLFEKGKATAQMHLARGTRFLIDKDYKKSIDDYEVAYRKNPEETATGNNLAFTLSEYGDKESLKRAETIVEEVIKRGFRKPRDRVNTLETRGRIKLKLEKWQEAIDDLEKVIGSFRRSPGHFRSLAKAHRALGNEQIAQAYDMKAANVERELKKRN